MNHSRTICAYLIDYAEPSLSDLTDAHLALAPTRGAKTAGWIIGHLCVTGDFVRRKCGQPPLTPKDWGPRFAPGTRPSPNAADYPRMAELRAALAKIYGDLVAIAPTLTPEILGQPNPVEFARVPFPTFGEFVTWVMTGHLGSHLGQLSGWRDALGMPLRPRAGAPI